MNHRGRILRDTNAGPGIVSLDGKQFSFTLETLWMSDIPPRPGMVVEASFRRAGQPDRSGSCTGESACQGAGAAGAKRGTDTGIGDRLEAAC